LTHESREHKKNEKSKKQVELDGDNEARSSKQGSSSDRQQSIGVRFDRLRFQNLHDERLLEAQVEKR
jgi:flagellar biosynthesis/type III secretory pathway chaperone